ARRTPAVRSPCMPNPSVQPRLTPTVTPSLAPSAKRPQGRWCFWRTRRAGVRRTTREPGRVPHQSAATDARPIHRHFIERPHALVSPAFLTILIPGSNADQSAQTAITGDPMGQGFDVRSDALRTYARRTEPDVERILRIRNRIRQLELSAGTFGKLPESDELKADYDTKQQDGIKDLGDAADALQQIVDAARSTADRYDGNEQDTTAGFGGA
ncbi:hypothetical protein NGM37_37215, partial [Streptomyces sp. TRM76130]|nr:hypothetical protein [Streptomyces sp. TRM76130]